MMPDSFGEGFGTGLAVVGLGVELYSGITSIKDAFKSFVDVEKSLKEINVILGATSANLKKFGSDLFEISKKTGTGFRDVAEAATELSRQGLGVAEKMEAL